MEGYLSANLKSDQILEQLPDSFIGQDRARCQSLFLGALRWGHRTRKAYRPLLRKSARDRVEAILLVAGYEIDCEPAGRHPKIIHHAVERSKPLVRAKEQGFLNAVLRQLPGQLCALDTSGDLAARESHPDWLVTHWLEIFGLEATSALLKWDQQIPPLYLKYPAPEGPIPACLAATEWENFYRIDTKADWKDALLPIVERGRAYFKDPSTRYAPDLLAAQPGDRVLDLCAAPGGKAFDLAQQMDGQGQITCVDLPGNRILRLNENLNRLNRPGLQSTVIEADLTELTAAHFTEKDLPGRYDAVMLDAPCSNTGVIQRRPDVKWRLRPEDIPACSKLQQQLIHSGARFVKPGGRFVYSTCSIEPSENRDLIDAFLASKSGAAFYLETACLALPWECGHDGASAFLLRRRLS
ncbi:MAG: RsmB/NOP family class I SAM-dependent RNA methyltransferase [Opitutales bacterium]